ncbi:MAG TPA: glycosyltransferase family 4 protein [Gaiellaceae bacterium]|jgi:glycosyltransferase involved in cell wall biosynthesis|nr:glycosyltransferase family 4 protein [Gaiellaceae bacterium]
MRILLWHGYLLAGTGSNVYTRALAREWSNAGHDVVVVSQEREPEQYDLGRAQTVAVDLPGGLLPVFVMDRYAGLKPKFVQDFSDDEKRAYVDANAAALRELLPADLVFANHVLMGGPVGAATGVPFRLKVHGSELEYSMRGRPELEEWGRASLAQAEATYVGSRHIREVLEDVVGHVDRVYEVPPGVDVDEFTLQDRDEALADLLREARDDPPNNGNERLPDDGNAERLAAFLSGDGPTVVYFGKLIEEKGVQVLLEAMRDLDVRLVVVGFGPYRATLEALAPRRTLFTGPLEHRHLVHLLPLADVTVVPSIFPEAFGMVAAEAAAAGSPPLVARHSGLAEVAAGLEEEYPERFRHLASFEPGDARDLAQKLTELLALSPADRDEVKRAGRKAVLDRWSWASVAQRLLA